MQKNPIMVEPNSFLTAVAKRKQLYVVIVIAGLLLVLLVIIFSLFKGQSSSNSLATLPNPAQTQNSEPHIASTDPQVVATLKQVSRLIVLPDGEVKVSTVVDPEALREQDPRFYKLAQKGDRVLLFSDRAVLYNPTANIIVDVLHLQ